MTAHDPFDALDPALPPQELAELSQFAQHLTAQRPVPRAGFRSDMRRQMLLADQTRRRPRSLRVLVTGYALAGLMLLGVAGLGVADSGPLAPEATGAQVTAQR